MPADAQIKANEVLTNRILSTEQKINTEFFCDKPNNKNINTLNNSIDVWLNKHNLDIEAPFMGETIPPKLSVLYTLKQTVYGLHITLHT